RLVILVSIMDDVGPQLPPHLIAKRKRQQEEAERASKEAKIVPKPSDNLALLVDQDHNDSSKRRRVVGPSLPPALIEEIPLQGPDGASEGEDSSSDDEIGPSLPGVASSAVVLL